MRYHIEERDAIRFVGLKYYVPATSTALVDGVGAGTIPGFWDKLPKETFDQLEALSDCIPESVVGVFGEKDFNGSDYLGFDYWIAAATTKPCPEGFGVVEVPAAKWIVFEGKGPMPGSIQNVFAKVYGEYFPNSKHYERRWDVYEIESFTKGDPTSDSYLSYAWVPVVEKKSE
ncbi:MAG: GyrI-like domain-containing protein [Coriobacteriales bacterium]|jgi:AraC family transcriptional regulator